MPILALIWASWPSAWIGCASVSSMRWAMEVYPMGWTPPHLTGIYVPKW
jgi:hypothetical protein